MQPASTEAMTFGFLPCHHGDVAESLAGGQVYGYTGGPA